MVEKKSTGQELGLVQSTSHLMDPSKRLVPSPSICIVDNCVGFSISFWKTRKLTGERDGCLYLSVLINFETGLISCQVRKASCSHIFPSAFLHFVVLNS